MLHKTRFSAESVLNHVNQIKRYSIHSIYELFVERYGSLIWVLPLDVISCAHLFGQDHHHPQHKTQGVPISWSPLGQYSPFWSRLPKTWPALLPDLHSPCDTSTVPPVVQHSSTVFPPLLQLYFHFSPGQHLFTELSLVWLDLVSSNLANQILLDNFSLTITGFLPDFQDFHRNLLQIRTDPCHSADSLWKYYSYCFRFRWTNKPSFRIINWFFFVASTYFWREVTDEGIISKAQIIGTFWKNGHQTTSISAIEHESDWWHNGSARN